MNTTRPLALALAALFAAACSPSFDPASEVKGFRLLAVQAAHPELAAVDDPDPGQDHATDLVTLVANRAFLEERGRLAAVMHVTCTPEPGNATATACSRLATLADPAALLAEGLSDPAQACGSPGVGQVNGITFSGVEACGLGGCGPVTVPLDPGDPGTTVTFPSPRYQVPAELSYSGFPTGAPERILGVEAVDLALALDVDPADLAPPAAVADGCAALAAFATRFQEEWPHAANVTALKRIVIRGPEARSTANQNPVLSAEAGLSGVQLDGVVLPAPAPDPTSGGAVVMRGAKVKLLPELPGPFEDLRETYTRVDSTGAPIEIDKKEDWAFSWFSTGGDLSDDHTTAPDEEEGYTPGAGHALVWIVVRDLRGGIAWSVAEVQAAP